jgi:MFS-type transporter involved in bile tolerance (Atg22 family)
MATSVGVVPDADLLKPRRRIQRGWYLYDCGVSGFSTVVTVVFYGPYITDVARNAATPDGQVTALGLSVSPGAVFPYAIALSVLLQVILVPLLGRLVDLTGWLRGALAILVASGSVAIAAAVTIAHDRWLASAALFVVATLAQGSSTPLYNALLP